MAGAPESKALFGNEYEGKFDTQAYVKNVYVSRGIADEARCGFPLRQMHKFWSTYPTDHQNLKVLDYGAGPTPIWQISSALHASEIVLAEFLESNRKALEQWVAGDSSLNDWSPYFKYAVQALEGKDEEEAKAREVKLRSLVKAIVPCDATQDPPIQRGYEGPYDVIITFLCLPGASKTEEEYKAVVARVATLLKPGGRIVMYEVEDPENSYYTYHTWKFHWLPTSENLVKTALDSAGFEDVQIEKLSTEGLDLPTTSGETNYKATMFIVATKPQATL